MTLNVENTARVIDDMVKRFRDAAIELEGIASAMRETNDFDYASSALNTVVSVIPNLRLDLLVSRSVRSHQREIETQAGEILTSRDRG